MSPNTVIGILNYKKQLDQDNAARAAEAQANLSETRPRTTGTYGPLANAVSANISGDQAPVTPMANPPVAGGVAKTQSNYDEPASEIQQYPELPTRPQLDRSNLAGPPGYGQRPKLVTGMPVEEGAAPPIGYNGGQLINAQDRDYLSPPVQPGFDATRGGMSRPDLQTYERSLNAKGEHIGKMARFGAGFKQDVRGGLINGLIGGVVDLANPGAGNKAVYENDTGEFDAQKQAELAQERSDPYYQNQLQSQQLRMDQPVKLQTYQAQRALELENQKTLLAQRGLQTIDQIGARGTQTVNAIQARATAKANGDINAARALYSGMIDPDTGKPFTPAQADQMARDDISDVKNAKLDKLWAQADLTTSRSENLDAVTKNLPQKFKDAHARVDALIQNAQTNAGRLKLQQGNSDQRAAYQDQLRQGSVFKNRLKALEDDLRGQYGILNNPYNSTPEKQAVRDAATERIKAINKDIDEVGNQDADTAGAPRKGQKATKPGAGGAGLTKDQETDYQVRKAKHPEMTREDYLKALKLAGK